MIGCDVCQEEYEDDDGDCNIKRFVSDMMERDKIFIESEYQLGRISMATRDYTTGFISKYLEALDA